MTRSCSLHSLQPPVSVEHVTSPSILVDGRFHEAASRWLRRKYLLRPIERRSTATPAGSRVTSPTSETNVGSTTQANAMPTFSPRPMTMSEPSTKLCNSIKIPRSVRLRGAQLSTLKQIHEFLREAYGVPLPFRLVTFTNPVGVKATTAIELRARTRQGSSGVPVTPGYAELLVQGALRIDRDGHQTLSRSVDRDAAPVSLGLATGVRHETLATITTYEIPALTDRPFTSCVFRTSSRRATLVARRWSLPIGYTQCMTTSMVAGRS